MYDVGLADRLRARGVEVVEIAGWATRGSSTFSSRGSVNHHTAGAAVGAVPSLAVCIYGRPDVPGPLCQVLLGRDLAAYVIAAGRANHAGLGEFRGLTGNRMVHGLEIEHTGYGPSSEQLAVAVEIHAAFLEAPGSSRDAGLVCQHFEWAPTRKVDFRELSPPFTPISFRAAVAAALQPALPDPAPIPPRGDGDMIYETTKPDGFSYMVHVTSGKQIRITGETTAANYRTHKDYVGEIAYEVAQRYDKAFGAYVV